MAFEPEALRLRDWTGLSCWPVFVYDRTYPVAGTTYKGKGIALVAAWLLRSGSVTITTRRVRTTAHAGEWIIPLQGEHTTRFSTDASILSVRFEASWPDGRPLLERKQATVLSRDNSRLLTRLAERLERFVTRNFVRADTNMDLRHARAEQYLQLNQHFLAWLSELVTQLREMGYPPSTPAKADERVLRAAHLLMTMPLGEPWTLHSLARKAGISPAHLTRLFVSAFSTTPKLYFLERRKRAAERLLQQESVPIKQIAHDLGFGSACYFTAWFRSNFGVAPTAWIESTRNRRNR